MDLGLAGRRAIVTGSSKGIERAIAAALLAEGARVTIAARGVAEAAVRSAVARTGRTDDDPRRVFDEYFGARRPLPAGRFGEKSIL